MIKILIADDHAIVRSGIKQILEKEPDIAVTDEAGNGVETLNKALKNNYDMVLLDIAMPERDGLEILSDFKREKPNIPVLMLSMYPEEQFALRALKMGASGYLTKDTVPDELIAAVRKVAQGKKYISSNMTEILAAYLEDDTSHEPHETLSDREYKVMCLIVSGKTLTEIATELSISPSTASTYRLRTLKKMKMKSNAELVQYATANKLIK
jgi:DNA-binding NarL/FixJ family response regulator